MSGNICAATNSPSPCSKATTISSTNLAPHGTSSPTTPNASPQSHPELGRRSILEAVGITGPAAAVNDIRTGSREKVFGVGNALHGIRANFRLAMVLLGQPFDLLDIEDGVTLHEGDRLLALLAGSLIGLGANDLVGVHDKTALLALADMRL